MEAPKKENSLNDMTEPFFLIEAKCPACGEKAVHRKLRDGSFVIEERDDDQFVSRYRWIKPEFQKYNIYFFKFWHCPHCHYTDEFLNYFSQKKQEEKKASVLLQIFRERGSKELFVQNLTAHLQYPIETVEDALLLHLLVCYLELMPDKRHQDWEKLARLFLRTAWLFRLMNAGADNQNPTPRDRETSKKYFALLEQLQEDMVNTLNDIESLNEFVSQQINDEQGKQPAEFWTARQNKLKEIYHNMTGASDTLIQNAREYKEIGSKYETEELNKSIQPLNAHLKNSPAFFELLKNLKIPWPELPLSEMEAIKQSIQYLNQIIESDVLEKQQVKLFKIQELLIILYEKIGEHETAAEYSNHLQNMAVSFRSKYKKKLESPNILSERNTKAINYFVKASDNIIQRNRARKENIRRAKVGDQERRAREIFHQNRNATVETIEEIMRRNDIDPSIIKKYLSLAKQEKKRGIFQIFKF